MARNKHFPQAGDIAGAVAIEYAIILPVLLLALLGAMDLGRLFWSYATIANAAQTAARCFAIKAAACQTAAATQSYAATQAYGITINASAFTVTTPACGAQVAASYVFDFVVPWFYAIPPFGGSNSVTLSTTSCYPT